MIQCVIVGAGGFLGAVLRYLAGLLPVNQEPLFPVKTLAVNVAGSFVIGMVAALAAKNSLDPKLALFLKTGVCGGFTTFSAFALETDVLLLKGETVQAFLYVALSVVLGVAAVFAAQKIFG